MAETPTLLPPDEWLRRYQLSRSAEGDQTKSQPYLGIHSIMVYVRDQDESIKFYAEKLGFGLVVDAPIDPGGRWVRNGQLAACALPKPRRRCPGAFWPLFWILMATNSL